MRKTLIVADSASSFTLEEAKELDIAILPLTIIIDQNVFQDVIEIDTERVYEAIRQNKNVSTSQVNIGYIEEKLLEWSTEYEDILIFSLPKSLSGTYSTIQLVIDQLALRHVYLHDCNNLAGVQQMITKMAVDWIKQGHSIEQILEEAERISRRSSTLIIPQTLDQLKKGGRISGAAAMMATLMKVKPVLALTNGGQSIDKYGIAKTDKKVNEYILKEIALLELTDDELMIYLLHADNIKRVEEVEILVKTVYPNSSIKMIDLPPVLVAHAGMGCIAIQACKK